MTFVSRSGHVCFGLCLKNVWGSGYIQFFHRNHLDARLPLGRSLLWWWMTGNTTYPMYRSSSEWSQTLGLVWKTPACARDDVHITSEACLFRSVQQNCSTQLLHQISTGIFLNAFHRPEFVVVMVDEGNTTHPMCRSSSERYWKQRNIMKDTGMRQRNLFEVATTTSNFSPESFWIVM